MVRRTTISEKRAHDSRIICIQQLQHSNTAPFTYNNSRVIDVLRILVSHHLLVGIASAGSVSLLERLISKRSTSVVKKILLRVKNQSIIDRTESQRNGIEVGGHNALVAAPLTASLLTSTWTATTTEIRRIHKQYLS